MSWLEGGNDGFLPEPQQVRLQRRRLEEAGRAGMMVEWTNHTRDKEYHPVEDCNRVVYCA